MSDVSGDVLYKNLMTLIKDRNKIIKLSNGEKNTEYLDKAINFLREKIDERQGR